MNDREPVAQMLNSVLAALDAIVMMALDRDKYDEIAAQEITLGQIISRTQLILSFIEARRSAPNRIGRVN